MNTPSQPSFGLGDIVDIFCDGNMIGRGMVVRKTSPDGVFLVGDFRKAETGFGPEWFPESGSKRLNLRLWKRAKEDPAAVDGTPGGATLKEALALASLYRSSHG